MYVRIPLPGKTNYRGVLQEGFKGGSTVVMIL